jgi:arylsulfatase A-like enzyme
MSSQMIAIVAMLPLIGMPVWALAAPDDASGGRPNVIVIMADDLGFGDLSCYGSEKIRTPVLDRLAGGGVRLTSFYTGATVCTPSRMALMTGSYPPRLGWKGGVLGYKIPTGAGLAAESRTMAEVFKGAGYRTALCGKWHLGSAPELLPGNQGFDHSFFIRLSNNQTTKLWRDDELVADPFDNRRLSEQFTQAAISFIAAESGQPFFLYLPFTAPHFPAQAHPDWEGKSRNGAYGDVVEELDARIGEVLGTLKNLELEEKTLVVFLSDNGPDPSQRKFATASPHRGLKWSTLDGGTRVPCIVSWPGVVPPGQKSDELIAAIDLLPTLAQACGITIDPQVGSPPIDGFSVWKTLSGQPTKEPHPRRDLIFWNGWAVPQAIRLNDWKLYFDEVEGVPGSEAGPALFDLASDPAEKNNLAASHPGRAAEMLLLAQEKLAGIATSPIALGGTPAGQAMPQQPRWLR